ncbi:HEAT repeat domain-containing protein [Rickettsia felis]|uniref:HEAT repeat domain-containing protein n=1 Tax=Rickettsia felis TaxID=42862 RepID=UPI00397C9D17
MRDAAVRTLGEVVKVKPSTAEEVFAVLRELLSDSDKYIKHAAVNSLGKISKSKV